MGWKTSAPARAWGAAAAAALAASAAAAACSDGTFVVQIPFTAQDHSAIVIIEQDARLEVIAVDGDTRNTMPVLRSFPDFHGNPPIRVTALLFDRSLAENGLTPGALTSPEDGVPLLSGARAVEESVVSGDGAGDWRPVTDPRPAIGNLKRPRATKCRTLVRQKRFDLDEPYMDQLYTLDARTALLVTYADASDTPKLYQVTMDDSTLLPMSIDNFTPRAGVQTSDGHIWIAGGTTPFFSPKLVAGTVRDGFVEQPMRTGPGSGSWLRKLAAPPTHEEDRTDIYSLSEFGVLERLENGTWSQLVTLDNTRFGNGGDLAWTGPDELLVVTLDKSELDLYSHGRVARETTPIDPDLIAGTDVITALGVVPGLGAFMGFASGYVLRREATGWTIFQRPLIAQHIITSLTGYDDGLLIGGDTGALQQWYPDEGFCSDVLYIGTDTNVISVVPIEGGLVVAGVQALSMTTQRIYIATIKETVE